MPVRAASDNAGAALAMLRRRDTKECLHPECKNVFEGMEVTNYCSDECRYAAAYLRRKDRAAAKARKEARKQKAKKAATKLKRKPRRK
jgi:hypothetical protein